MKKYRISRTVIFSPDEEYFSSYNYLTKQSIMFDGDLFALFRFFARWREHEESLKFLDERYPDEDVELLNCLLDADVLVAENSVQSKLEIEAMDDWEWGLPAAMMHFGVQDNDYFNEEEIEARQICNLAQKLPPPLTLSNRDSSDVISLPSDWSECDLMSLLSRRRTQRNVQLSSLSVAQLSDMLMAGLGIVGYTENCVGRLPLKMTPSGGARNPFEAYVLVSRVRDLRKGIYHYSAADHSLGRIGSISSDKTFGALAAGQNWMNDMAAVIVLVAHLDRTMWKYKDDNAYRVVMIEAGHIGQNIMVAATKHNLTACPTAALAHSSIASEIGLKSPLQTPVYMLGVGQPLSD